MALTGATYDVDGGSSPSPANQLSSTPYAPALARWHQDRWFEAKLSRPPRVTPVIKRKELAAGFAGSKV